MKIFVNLALVATVLRSTETNAFTVPPAGWVVVQPPASSLLSLSDEPNQDELPPQSLIVDGAEMEAKMQQLRSKYPTSEADYLAAARARAKAKPESREIAATQEDFEKVAQEKKQQGFLDVDDWEASATEAGNTDSQILFPQLPDDEDGEGGAEPTLLL